MSAAPAVAGRRLLPNFAVLLTAHLLSKATTLVSLFLLGRYLGDQAFGRYAVAFAIPVALEALGDLGTSQTLIRDGAGRPEAVRRDAVGLLPAKFVLAALLVIASVIAGRLLDLPAEIAEMVLYLSLAKALDSFTILARSVFEAFERMDFEAASLILDAVVRLALIVFALLNGFGLVGLSKAMAVSSAIVLVATVAVTVHRFVGLRHWSFDRRRTFAVLAAGLPLATVWFFEGLSFRVDTIIVGRYLGDEAAGLFSAAVRLVEPLLIVPLVMAMTMLPVISRHLLERRDTLGRLFRAGLQLALLAAILESIVLIGLAREIATATFGPEFAETGRILRILALALFPLVIRVMLVNVMTALHAQRCLLVAQLAGTATNIALALALVQAIGANGAVVAILAGEGITIAVAWWFVRGAVVVDLRELVRIGAVGLTGLAVLTLGAGLGPYLATAAALVTVVVGVRLGAVVHEEDKRYLVHAVPRFARLTLLVLGPVRPR